MRVKGTQHPTAVQVEHIQNHKPCGVNHPSVHVFSQKIQNDVKKAAKYIPTKTCLPMA